MFVCVVCLIVRLLVVLCVCFCLDCFGGVLCVAVLRSFAWLFVWYCLVCVCAFVCSLGLFVCVFGCLFCVVSCLFCVVCCLFGLFLLL